MESSTVSPSSVVAPRRRRPGQHAVAARDEQRGLRERHLAVGQVHAGQVALQVVDADDRARPSPDPAPWPSRCPTSSAPTSPGPDVTATASRSGPATPASSSARATIGVMVSVWARLASSGTTPPKLACRSTWLATTEERTSSVLVDDRGGRLVARRLDRQQDAASRQPRQRRARSRPAGSRPRAPPRALGPRTLTSVDGTSVELAAVDDQVHRRRRGWPPRRPRRAASARRAGWRWSRAARPSSAAGRAGSRGRGSGPPPRRGPRATPAGRDRRRTRRRA